MGTPATEMTGSIITTIFSATQTPVCKSAGQNQFTREHTLNTASGYQMIPLTKIIPTPDNPRAEVDQASPAFTELVASIKSVGLLQPLLARPHPKKAGSYDLRLGHRRLLALKVAGLKEAPVIVRELDDKTALDVTVIENLHREDLTPMEEGRGVAALLRNGHSAESAAAEIGKSKAWVLRRSALAGLIPELVKVADEHRVSAAMLELIARYAPSVQKDLYTDITTKDRWGGNKVGVIIDGDMDKLKRYLANRMHDLKHAQWSLTDELLVPTAGSCATCTKRSGCAPELFQPGDLVDDQQKKPKQGGKGVPAPVDMCLDVACWDAKAAAILERKMAAAKTKHPDIVMVSTSYGSVPDGVLSYSNWSDSSKRASGSFVAFVAHPLDSSRIGQIIYITRYGSQRGKSAAKKATKDAGPMTPKAAAEKLKESKSRVTQRRQMHVIEAVKKILEKSSEPAQLYSSSHAMLLIALAYGVEVHTYSIEKPATIKGHPAKVYARLTELTETALVRAEAWGRLKPELRSVLMVSKPGDIGEDKWTTCQQVIDFIGADLATLEAAAVADIPDPKVWSALSKLANTKSTDTKSGKAISKSGQSGIGVLTQGMTTKPGGQSRLAKKGAKK